LEDKLFGRHDLTAQQYNALRLLRGVCPNKLRTLDLAARLVSRAPDITRLLDKLEQRGQIERTRPPANRREVWVSITEAGLALLPELAAPVRARHARHPGHLSGSQLDGLVELLR